MSGFGPDLPAGRQELGEVALEHVPFVREGAQGWVGQVVCAGFGQRPEVSFEAGRHLAARRFSETLVRGIGSVLRVHCTC